MKVPFALVLIAVFLSISNPFGRFSQADQGNSSSLRRVPSAFLECLSRLNRPTLRWPDRRPIGSLVLATANTRWPGNPRGWFLDPTLDVRTEPGRQLFRRQLLAWADKSIVILKAMNAQGMVTWDIEGEQFPHRTTYLGEPEDLAKLAPEMDSAADEYFARFVRAGLRVGVTIRPQTLVLSQDGQRASQVRSIDPVQVLNRKIAYARKRWGATLFYIDSNGDQAIPLAFAVISQVADANPDVLLIPEHKTAGYYSKTAPYSELRKGAAATPPLVRDLYPGAFSIINVSDGLTGQNRDQLKSAVDAGDVLMFRAWFDDPGNRAIRPLIVSRFAP